MRLRSCGAESGRTHAAAVHGDGCGDQGDGVRPVSAAGVHARLLRSLSLFETSPVFCWSFFGAVMLSSKWFLGHVQVRIDSERSPRENFPRKSKAAAGGRKIGAHLTEREREGEKKERKERKKESEGFFQRSLHLDDLVYDFRTQQVLDNQNRDTEGNLRKVAQTRPDQHSTAQHRPAQHRPAQTSTAQHSTALHCTGQTRTDQDRPGQNTPNRANRPDIPDTPNRPN